MATNRTEKISIRLKPNEKLLLEQEAEKHDVKIFEFCRYKLLKENKGIK